MSALPELPTRYVPGPVEGKWYKRWLEREEFGSTPDPAKKPYTIVIPPPNVTGALHMGHALNTALQDILIRWRRMQGFEALWIPGTDHAGIATQSVVENLILREEQKTRHDIGREEMLRRIWAWKEKYGGRILEQLKKLGASCDWSRLRFTMDEGLSRAVREVFVRFYRKGLIYRGRYLVNWCPQLRTALADDEVDHRETEGHLWHFRYPLEEDPQRFVTVATTRPETMLGDTAVAVHPEDPRYRGLVGKTVRLPLVDRVIPIVGDPEVSREFGTGAVKVTPAHDPIDFQIGERHGLAKINILNEDGTINAEGGRFAGMDRFAAREAVVQAFEKLGLLEKVEPHTHNVGHCYRTGDVIEPYLSLQWFVRMKPLAEKAIEATRSGRVRFHPERWTSYYLSWLENVRDWCISRQIWWGHRVPIWYAPDGTPFTGLEEEDARREAREAYGKEVPLTQDEDVLDTWFSSGLWPFSTLGWPDQTDDLAYYFPTSTLSTDRGIIFFWVARMVMMSEEIMGSEPFSDVYIHGTINDRHGRKMSKSLGNGIDPVALIEGGTDENTGVVYEEAYGADAVRFSLTTLSVEGQDLRLWPDRFEDGRRFVNKLWNAGRFALLQLDAGRLDPAAAPASAGALQFEDRWILSRLVAAVRETTAALDGFQYCTASQRVRDFVWSDFCDWYVELVKNRLPATGGAEDGAVVDTADARVGRQVLAYVFDALLRLLHPVCPFITEELWSLLARVAPVRARPGGVGTAAPAAEAIIRAPWPEADVALHDPALESEFALVQGVVQAVRKLRQERNLGARQTPAVFLSGKDQATVDALAARRGLIAALLSAKAVEIGLKQPRPPQAATEVLKQCEVSIQVPETDVGQEREVAEKRRRELRSYLDREEKKLQNPSFLDRAPANVVEATRQRVSDTRAQLQAVNTILASLAEKPSSGEQE